MTHRSRLVELFARVCADRRSDIALRLLSDGNTVSFDGLWQDFLGYRHALQAAGVRPGSSVVSLVGNRPEFVTTLLAALDNGAVVLALDSSSPPREASALAERFGAVGVMAPSGALPGVRSTSLGRSQMSFFRPCLEPIHTDITSPAVLKITSGSDGKPKAVRCTEDNLVADGLQILEAMDIGPRDINMGAIPISHSYGLGNLLMPLVLQGSGIALRQSFVPQRFFEDVSNSGATVFPGVPFMFDYLRRHQSGARTSASLRLLVSAAAPIQHAVVESVKRDLGLKIHSFYGTSETGGIAYDASDGIEDPVPMGRALPGVTLTLHPVDQEDQSGRVHVRSKAVASGYTAGMDAADSSAFCDGGFLTGDVGYFDRLHRLILTGRVSRFVNVAGRKIHPEEVEQVLHQMPQVEAARVVGVPCKTRGEALVACIVPTSGEPLDASSVRRYCAERLAGPKIPRLYVFLDVLPTDARGKTDLQQLKSLALDHMRVE